MKYPVDVTMSGAVSLGRDVVCDGFLRAPKARVQTHIHSDHMRSFDSSKGYQEILLSESTRQLICLERNAELPYRSNIIALPNGEPYRIGTSTVTLLASGHMLGSVQVAVDLENGARVGYSGDFQWPLDPVIKVDALVVDSTYGSPDSIRRYSQGQCEAQFLELVLRQLARGPVHIIAHRGTLQRALQALSGEVDCSILGSSRLCAELEIYRKFGYAIGLVLTCESEEAKEVVLSGRFIRCYGTGDQRPADIVEGTTIKLSAFFARPDDPVTEYSERAYGVALSNHADFKGTLEYIRATGAEFVVTDNSRGGKGVKLAMEIQNRLSVEARPSSNFETKEWGR